MEVEVQFNGSKVPIRQKVKVVDTCGLRYQFYLQHMYTETWNWNANLPAQKKKIPSVGSSHFHDVCNLLSRISYSTLCLLRRTHGFSLVCKVSEYSSRILGQSVAGVEIGRCNHWCEFSFKHQITNQSVN